MSTSYERARCYLEGLLRERSLIDLKSQLEPKPNEYSATLPGQFCMSEESLEQRWQILGANRSNREALADVQTLAQRESYSHNIENFIGTVKLPLGLAGPLRINGLFAQGDYYVPLATTEAALVASLSRGARLISEAGGCTAILLNEGISRAPSFGFANLREAGLFTAWALDQFDEFRHAAQSTTGHGKLIDMRIEIEGNHVYLVFEFRTGDAAGQNMATIATEAICTYISSHAPVRPQYCFIEANASGDKKASTQSFLSVRGKKVTAEIVIDANLVKKRLHTTPEQIAEYWRVSAIGAMLSGTIGAQGHYANGLAALFLACGQDVACVAESAVGITRFEITDRGELYASVTLPNLIVGTVGGGTGLPSQKACLEIMGLAGEGKVSALAEVCAGLCLAGDISITAAVCAGKFARAHRCLARDKKSRKEFKEHAYDQALVDLPA